MKPLSSKKALTVSVLVTGLIWIAVALTLSTLFYPLMPLAGSLTGGLLALAMALVYILCIRHTSDSRTAEAGTVSAVAVLVFLAVSCLVNTCFLVLGLGSFGLILSAVNTAIDLLFVIVCVFAEHYAVRVSSLSDRLCDQQAPAARFSRTLGELLAMTDEPAVRTALLRLKEAVDCGPQLSNDAAASYEVQLTSQLTEIFNGISTQTPEVLLEQIHCAEATWKRRCTLSSR